MPCRGRACPARSLTVESPLTVCFVGRGLDPSATSRETAVNGISVGEGFIPPVYLPSPLTSAGRRGRRPLQRRSVNLPPPYTPAAARGLAALRPPVTVIRKGKFIPPGSLVLPPPRRGRACPARSLAVAARLSFASQGAVLTAPRGVGDAAPYSGDPQTFRRRQPRGRIGNPPLRTNKNRCPCVTTGSGISRSRLIHTAGTSSSAPRPCWRPRPSCSQSQTRSLQCSRRSPSSRRDPCRGS